MRCVFQFQLTVCLLLATCPIVNGQTWPEFPVQDAAVEIPAPEWPMRPGERKVRVLIHFPDGQRTSVNAEMGIMLSLHNWGGVDCVGTAAPGVLVTELNVVAVCANYLQSGPDDSIKGREPYDAESSLRKAARC